MIVDLEEFIETIKRDLRDDEGFRAFPYRDTTGHLTVGFGRNLEDVPLAGTEAELMLSNDVHRTLAALWKRFPWTRDLSDARQAVLVNMAFNMGLGKLAGFQKMLDALQAEAYDLAAIEMLDSAWAKQVGKRATRLAEVMRTGGARQKQEA